MSPNITAIDAEETYTLLAGVDEAGVVQCGLVVERSTNAEVDRMLKQIKKYGYTKHWQHEGTITIGLKLGEKEPEPTSKPTQEVFSF
jgi:hypothetical protein